MENMEKHELPDWCKEAKKALIDRGMKIKELAEALDNSREYTSAVINDTVRSPGMKKRICDYLGVRAS